MNKATTFASSKRVDKRLGALGAAAVAEISKGLRQLLADVLAFT